MTRLSALASVAFGVVLMAGTTPAAAQSLTVKGGVNFATIAVDPDGALGETGTRIGVAGGASVALRETSRLSFEVAGLLSIRRIGFGPDITDTVTYVEAPVLARYAFMKSASLRVRAVGGVVPAFRLAASEKVAGASFSVKDAYKPIDIAIALGAQADWKDKWVFDVRYLLGVSDVYEVTAGGERTRQRVVQVLVGYRLR